MIDVFKSQLGALIYAADPAATKEYSPTEIMRASVATLHRLAADAGVWESYLARPNGFRAEGGWVVWADPNGVLPSARIGMFRSDREGPPGMFMTFDRS